MRTLMVVRGLPGCGKSTFAKELLKKEPDRWKRVNRDELRNMLDNGRWSPDNEELVKKVQDEMIKQSMREGFDVIVDNTHLVSSTVRKVHQLAEHYGDVKVIEKCFNVDVKECHRRNQLREGPARVPDKVIDDMASKAGITKGRKLEDKETYYQPRWVAGGPGAAKETRVQDQTLPKAILCDLDGTLAIMGDRSPYDASRCDEVDHPNVPVIECVKAMYAQGVKVIFMSGREDKHREPSVRFIEQHLRVPVTYAFGLVGDIRPTDVVVPYELYMRETADQRKDSIVKNELFAAHVEGKYNVLFVLDDRNQVVDEWRRMGLTCYQVAEGNF